MKELQYRYTKEVTSNVPDFRSRELIKSKEAC